MHHTTGFDREEIIDLCIRINSAARGTGTSKWPPCLGLFKSVAATLTYMRHNRTQASCAGLPSPLTAGQPAVLPGPGIPLGLFDPLPDRGLGQVEVLRDLTRRPVPALAQLNDLGLELRGERAAAPGLLPRPIAGALSEQGFVAGRGNTSARWPGGRTGVERGLDGGGDELGGLGVDGDVPAEQHAADDVASVPGSVLRIGAHSHISAPS